MPGPFEEMGFELKLYVGPAGAPAATQVTSALDVDYDLAPQKAPTTDRGTGGLPPITYENVVQRGVTITWSMNNDQNDAFLATLIAAAIAGAPVAVLVKTGNDATLFDGDVTLAKKYNAPLSGAGTYDFSATPTKQSGRNAILG